MFKPTRLTVSRPALALKLAKRFNSDIPTPRKRPSFFDLLRTPTAKSLFLITVFGTVVVDSIANRKKLEQLREDHSTKVLILKDIIDRLKRGEKFDLQSELKIANGAQEVQIDIDEKLEEFFKLADDSKPEGDDNNNRFI